MDLVIGTSVMVSAMMRPINGNVTMMVVIVVSLVIVSTQNIVLNAIVIVGHSLHVRIHKLLMFIMLKPFICIVRSYHYIFHYLKGCSLPDGWGSGQIGNGACSDVINNPGCNYDDGDCCGSNVNTYWCTECYCYENCLGSFDLIGNGFCDDETNNADCNFDGGDCCGWCANTDQCSDCVCHDPAPVVTALCKYFVCLFVCLHLSLLYSVDQPISTNVE